MSIKAAFVHAFLRWPFSKPALFVAIRLQSMKRLTPVTWINRLWFAACILLASAASPTQASEIVGRWSKTSEGCQRGEYEIEVQQSQLSWGSGDWSCQLRGGFREETKWVVRGECCVVDYECDRSDSQIELELTSGVLKFQVLGISEPSYYAFKCKQ
jgi:hypothetical protein